VANSLIIVSFVTSGQGAASSILEFCDNKLGTNACEQGDKMSKQADLTSCQETSN
jgi:hypothetical protein